MPDVHYWGIDVLDLQVLAMCVIAKKDIEVAVLLYFLEQSPANEPLLKVLGVRADDMQPVHATVMQRNVTPIIRQKKNVRMRKDVFLH
ncbi:MULTISPECIES: hypothetical protein [Comamonas]|uniref:Uncharacterized protein n=1 Tax=Comamonas testosteroni TK102 TaxID=1392005 RepID=A0A076PQN9_COMTE|nr:MULTISPECIES: hypothetical protein [Comamonas]AIJ45712.1 hypothetical protein O987_07820 [Comamonas testosteroni TK102]MPS87294.1 hypothetical protein [Comamonas sp.]MPT10241.1 hypothetical protein [Comamonas sp.]